MIAIEQLRYVRLGTPDLAAATDFAQRILGLQIVDKTPDQVFFRSDYRDHTLVYARADKPSCTVAFEVRDIETLDAAEKALASAGYKVTRGTAEEAERRKVKRFLSFADRSGNVFELVVRPLQSGWRYFPSRDAGILGLEDIALRSTANGADEALWTKVFNGRVSDRVGEGQRLRDPGTAGLRSATMRPPSRSARARTWKAPRANWRRSATKFTAAPRRRPRRAR